MAIPVGTAVGYLDLDYSKFSKKLDTAITEANGLSNKFSDTLGSGLTTLGDKIATVGTRLSTNITVPLGLAAASAVKFGADFDKGMSNVKAVSGATQEEFETMRDAAIDWGEKTVYTATEASDALYYMGLAGWNANNSVAALGPVLNLAAAGNLELGRTSDIVTDAMTALQIEADGYTNGIANAEHFTNALASAMSNSNTDVDQLGEAFKYVAPVAGSLGYSIEDLSLALGTMANVGVKGSQAGTGLRQALKNLITPANDAAAALMDELGISLFDSEGKALSFKEVMDNLRTTFGGVDVDIEKMSDVLENEGEDALLNYVDGLNLTMTQQEKLQNIVEIFGTRALPGVLGIINASDDKFNNLANSIYGSDKAFVQHGNDIMTYKEAVEQFGEELVNTSGEFQVLGAAEGMAMIQMDNLSGDWTRFTSALGTTRIEITDLVNGALRGLVQKLTELVTWFNGLDDEQQKNILKWAAIIASIGPVLLVFGKLISGIGNTITAFSTIGGALSKLRIGFGMLSTVIKDIPTGFNLAKTGLSGFATESQALGVALGSISAPMVAIAAIIAALVASFVHLMKTNEEFREKVFAIWDGLKAKFDEAGQKITDAINKLGFDFDNFFEVLRAGFDWFSNTIAPVFLAAFDTISGTISGIIDIFVGFFEILSGLIIGFRDGDWSTFKQGIEDYFGGLFNLMTAPFRLVFNTVTRYLEKFGLTWSDVWDAVKDVFMSTLESIKTTVQTHVNEVIAFFTMLYDGVVSIFNSIKDFFYGIVMSIIQHIALFVHSLEETWTNIKQSVQEFHDSVKAAVEEFLYNVIMYIIRFIVDTKHNIAEFVENVRTKFDEMKQAVIDKVLTMVNDVTTKFYQIKSYIETVVSTILRIVTNKFNEMKLNVVRKVSEIKHDIIEKFSDIKDKFFEIGSNIVSGIWKGISSGWQWLNDKVSNLAKSLLDSAKSALDIHSPSGAFRDDFGYWLPLGAVEGVEKSMPKAVDEIQDAFDDGLSKVNASVDIQNPLIGIVDTVEKVLNDATIWFESIEDRLNITLRRMREDLMNLIDLGQVTIDSNGVISGLVYDRPTRSLKPIGDNGEKSSNVVNNFYYTFNSPKAIDEIEASRKLKETQRDLAEGF